MNLKWHIVLALLTLICWNATPAAAEKVKHFKDDQGTLHITNVKPEDQAKTGAETLADGTIKLRVQEPKPAGGAFPARDENLEPPPEEIEVPEPPQPEEPPEEVQPDEGG